MYQLSGKRFGKLTAIERCGGGNWLCRCDCGNICRVLSNRLVSGGQISCGCAHRARLVSGVANRKHGRHKTPEWVSWIKMKERCLNKNAEAYQRYGANGITVCERWLESFENFFADLGPIPSPKHNTIDRISNDRGYEPGNCRWATRKDQAVNRRSTTFHEHGGIRLCRKDWAKRLGVTRGAITYRLERGESFSEIVEHLSPKMPHDGRER